jgi:3-hydroxyisobutyrate dehydrogenase-like beta-hydroxyacid dehydrogenase
MHVALIGLGQMGSGIARNILKAGHQLTVYNRTHSRAEELKSSGASVADSPGQAAASAEVLITMLSDDHALEDVVFSKSNVLETLAPGAVHVSMSTISVALSRRLESAHHSRKQHYVAAPVFGRPEAAAAAKLFVVAAGAHDQIERCRPIFDAVGQRTFVASAEPHLANVVKLCGNFMITSVMESLAESMALVRKSGMDASAFLEIMTGSLFNAPIYKTYGTILAQEKFKEVGFKLSLGFKDNRLVRAAAQDAAVPMPLASLIGDLYLSAIAQGLSECDWSAIADVTFRNAGIAGK